MATLLGEAGGIIAILLLIVTVARGIFKNVKATEDNTAAVRELSVDLKKIDGRTSYIETRLAVLEDWKKRGSE